jgi:hypothetical protein
MKATNDKGIVSFLLAAMSPFFFGMAGCIPTSPLLPTDSTSRPTKPKQQVLSEDPKIVLGKAIKAMGGEAALKRINVNDFKGHGRMMAGGVANEYRLHTQNALPDRVRELIEYVDAEGKTRVTVLSSLNRDKGFIMYNAEFKEMDAAAINSWKDVLYHNLVMSLIPLQGPTFTLVAEPQQRKEGVLCQAFTVKSKGHPDITLYFDTETSLPVLVQTTIVEANTGQEMKQELYLREYKDFSGLKYPTRWVVYQNGNKSQEFTIEEALFPDKVDEQTFAKP